MSREDFIDIFNEHFEVIRTFMFYRCGSMDMASDVAQEVFLKIWEKQYTLDGTNTKPMLYKIAMSCYISKHRRRKCRADFEQSIVPEYESTPEEEMIYSELTATYAKALMVMTEKQRTVFLMNREDGMKYSEIADCLKISPKAVEKHISAALKVLRAKLSGFMV